MSGKQDETDDTDFSRRTFMKASGTLAAAGLLGAGAAGQAAADFDALDDRLLNWRVAEAQKVWERGYRGRPDRTLGITDSGVAAVHPDLGPWNGLRIRPDGDDGDIELVGIDIEEADNVPVTEAVTFDSEAFSGEVAGSSIENLVSDETDTFELEAQDGVQDDDNVAVLAHQITATLTWNIDTPEAQVTSIRATLERDVGDDEFEEVDMLGTTFVDDVPEDNELQGSFEVEPGTYRFVVEPTRGAATYDLDVDLQTVEDTGDTESGTVTEPSEFNDEILPEEGASVGTETPKTVAWYNEQDDWGDFDVPRDENGHGTHVAGIMTATGRASTIDENNTEIHEPNSLLLPGDFIEYEVEGVPAGTGVFASGIGQGAIIEIVHDNDVIHESPLRFDSIIADAPTVHDSGTATYTVRVKPAETESTLPVLEQAQEGNPLGGRIEKLAVGAYKHPAETDGDRTEDDTTVHSGVAPNFSLAGFQGLGGPTEDLGDIADAVADTLNMRAVNMSWGPLLGAPLSAFGLLEGTAPAIRDMADAGILSVAAAGNSWTPANGNGEPAAVGEAISVVATDPFDGITGYSSGGIGQLNEDDDGFDFKPDVTAPGGDIKPDAFAGVVAGLPGQLAPIDLPGVNTPTPDNVELVRATLNPVPDPDLDPTAAPDISDLDIPRDHQSIGGTSMASPYVCGVAGLVAQAMEEDAPESIALPEPGADEMDRDATMRLKQVILSTASTTAFTAAPYHNAQLVPSPAAYTHGERDPYEGFGRVNPDAAVDAVTRNLLEEFDVESDGSQVSEQYQETVGLDIPFDSRAVAGYVTVRGGELDVSVAFDSYSGGNRGMAAGDPHLDLFVYDAENPTDVGEPTIVESDIGQQGEADVTVDIETAGPGDELNERTLFVVAKLVNIPGVVNGFDVQADFDLDVTFTPDDLPEIPEPTFIAEGDREFDLPAQLGGNAQRVQVTVEDIRGEDFEGNEVDAEAGFIYDRYPESWNLQPQFSEGVDASNVDAVDEDNAIVFGEFNGGEFEPFTEERTYTYTIEAPDALEETGPDTFGPAEALLAADTETEFQDDADEFAGEDNNISLGGL